MAAEDIRKLSDWLRANRQHEGTPQFAEVASTLAGLLGDAPQGASEPQVPGGDSPQEPETTLSGLVAGAIRGAGPIGAGAALGAALGAPAAGVGAIPGAAAGALAAGLTTTVGDPLVDLWNEVTGDQARTPSQVIQDALTAMGVEVPDTAAEKITQAAAEGAALTGSSLGAGGLLSAASKATSPVAAGVGRTLSAAPVAQVAGGTTAGALSQAAAEADLPVPVQVGAGLLGGGIADAAGRSQRLAGLLRRRPGAVPDTPQTTAGAGAMEMEQLGATARKAAMGKVGREAAQREVALQASPDPATVAAAKRLGVADDLQADHVTTNQVFREFKQALKSRVGSPERQAELEGIGKVVERADRLVRELGATDDLSALTGRVRGRMEELTGTLKDKSNALYKEVDDAIPADTPVTADSMLSWIDNRIREVRGVDRLEPEIAALRKALIVKEGGEPLSYAFLDAKRKEFTAARVKNSGPFASVQKKLIGDLERHLAEDQRRVVGEIAGPETLQSLRTAQRLVATRKGIEGDMVTLLGKHLDGSINSKLFAGVRGLPAGDVERLNKLISAVPRTMRQEVVASGLVAAMQRSAGKSGLNFNTYSTWFEGLQKNPKAFAALMANLPAGAPQRLKDLALVSRGINRALNQRITTGRLVDFRAAMTDAGKLMGKFYDLAEGAVAGGIAAAAVPLVGKGTGFLAGLAARALKRDPSARGAKTLAAIDGWVASPEFRHLVAEMGTADAERAIRRAAKSGRFKRLWSAVKDSRKVEATPEKWLVSLVAASKEENESEAQQ